jgi:translation initiation factor IF-2
MADDKKMWRLVQAAKNLNVSIKTVSDFLTSKGFAMRTDPNFQINQDQYNLLQKEFASSVDTKNKAANININKSHNDVIIKSEKPQEKRKDKDDKEIFIKNVGSSEVNEKNETEVSNSKLPGLTVLGKIDLNTNKTNDKNDGKGKEYRNNTNNQTHNNQNNYKGQNKDYQNKSQDQKNNDNKNTNSNNNNNRQNNNNVNKNNQQNPFQKNQQHNNNSTNNNNQGNKNKPPEIKPYHKPVEKVEQLPDTKLPDDLNDKNLDDSKKNFTVSEVMSQKKDKQFIQDFKDSGTSLIEAKADKLQGLTVLGKIDLSTADGKRKNKPVASSDDASMKKKKRKRIRNRNKAEGDNKPQTPKLDANGNPIANTNTGNNNNSGNNQNRNNNSGNNQNRNNNNSGNNQNRNNNTTGNNQNRNNNNSGNNQNRNNNNSGNNQNRNNNTTGNNQNRNNTSTANTNNAAVKKNPAEVTEKEIQEQIKNTLARLNENKNSQRRLNKREKKIANARKQEVLQNEQDAGSKVLKLAEFISANDLATMMDVAVNEVISKCLSFGMFVSINQRLDAEAIMFIADEFDYTVEFTTAEQEVAVEEAEIPDDPKDLVTRAPIVTIMGHVDHGKTSLLDFIRRTKVVEKEAGGITQHIGAYDVMTKSGRQITFLDTPGHEAFTAMRARGAKVTDVAIIVIAADDSVMPQTKEAINHAQNGGVPIVFAFNKVDKAGADAEKIRKELAELNILVETWGGKYQDQEISAKKGLNIDELLEKVLVESDLLELKANPKRKASGAVIEATLDKGRGYVTTILVQTGTLRVGDAILAGSHYGKVKAMTDHTGKRIHTAGPSVPVQVIGFNGAPQAGDKFNVMENERAAREIASKREQILREQSIRTTKRTTLGDLGRRIALGNFKQLNLIVKGDVDGSVEALSDSLLKLSSEEIEVKVIHKGVGQISESDVLLAAASDAIILGFQVRPSVNAKRLAEQEQVDVRMYSIIYDAINEVKAAMEGMLAPVFEEIIVGNIDIREIFKISKVGIIAGCMVTGGYVKRNSKVRVIREGIVVFGGGDSGGADLSSLKRFKDDVAEVKFGFDCGLSVKNFNDMRIGDTIEVFELKELKRKL